VVRVRVYLGKFKTGKLSKSNGQFSRNAFQKVLFSGGPEKHMRDTGLSTKQVYPVTVLTGLFEPCSEARQGETLYDADYF